MDDVIIGTAGHIDHGKTTLIKALTGIDTDRFQEEKERGISIDIGFAPLVLSDGRRVGIVDVPGHERFIRNMLAGVGGVDFILLVVDAREGVMPQTREHLAILSLLQVRRGLIVVTKVDLVDKEWLEFAHHEIRQELKDSFLAKAPLVDVSSVTGEGIENLKRTIEEWLPSVSPKNATGSFRLPIDRAFVVQGIGTVVTGTIWRGRVRVGDTLTLLPPGEPLRVRGIQVHGVNQDTASAGQRAAMAIAGLRGEVRRGMTLTGAMNLSPSRLLDAQIEVIKDAPRSLRHRERIRLYLGTAEVLGRVLLLKEFEVNPGESAVAQVLLETDAVAELRDRFVIRTYSPMRTIAGGVVIDPQPKRLYRRNKTSSVEAIRKKAQGTLSERVLAAYAGALGLTVRHLSEQMGEAEADVRRALDALVEQGELVAGVREGEWIAAQTLRDWTSRAFAVMTEYYRKNPYDLWLPRSVLRADLRTAGIDATWHEELLARVATEWPLVQETDRLRFAARAISLTGEERQAHERVLAALLAHPYAPPSPEELERALGTKDRGRLLKTSLHVLQQEDLVVMLQPDLIMARQAVQTAAETAKSLFREKGAFSLADFRDRLATSRKYAVALLEYFDRQKWTRRSGEVREWIIKS